MKPICIYALVCVFVLAFGCVAPNLQGAQPMTSTPGASTLANETAGNGTSNISTTHSQPTMPERGTVPQGNITPAPNSTAPDGGLNYAQPNATSPLNISVSVPDSEGSAQSDTRVNGTTNQAPNASLGVQPLTDAEWRSCGETEMPRIIKGGNLSLDGISVQYVGWEYLNNDPETAAHVARLVARDVNGKVMWNATLSERKGQKMVFEDPASGKRYTLLFCRFVENLALGSGAYVDMELKRI